MPSRRQQQQSGGEPTRQVASCISCRVASCSLTQQHSRAPLAHRLVPLRLGRGGTSRGTGLGSTGTIRSAADQRTTARTRSCQLTKRRMTFGRRWTRRTALRDRALRPVHGSRTSGVTMLSSLLMKGSASSQSTPCLSQSCLPVCPQRPARRESLLWPRMAARRLLIRSQRLWPLSGCVSFTVRDVAGKPRSTLCKVPSPRAFMSRVATGTTCATCNLAYQFCTIAEYDEKHRPVTSSRCINHAPRVCQLVADD